MYMEAERPEKEQTSYQSDFRHQNMEEASVLRNAAGQPTLKTLAFFRIDFMGYCQGLSISWKQHDPLLAE